MSRKKKKSGLIETAVGNAIDKVADTAVDKLKGKIDDVAPAFIGDAIDGALDNLKDNALDKAKAEIKEVAVKQSKKIVKKVIRRSITLAVITGCTAVAFKNRKAIVGFVKEKIG